MTDRIEGSGASQLVQLIQKIGYNDFDSILLATVTSSAPALKIRVDGMKIELDMDDIVVAEHLTKHTRNMKITASGTASLSANVTGGTMDSGSAETIKDLTLSGGSLTVTEATVEYLDELKVGDRVIVSSMNNGQTYVILDRMVQYGA